GAPCLNTSDDRNGRLATGWGGFPIPLGEASSSFPQNRLSNLAVFRPCQLLHDRYEAGDRVGSKPRVTERLDFLEIDRAIDHNSCHNLVLTELRVHCIYCDIADEG